MEIGQYISKFLFKNKYCSLPGLGVFELKKIPAYESKNELNNPSHVISFSPIGSIDDTFASYIASFENVSISNASNNIKEYCKYVKEEIAKTGKFEIDNLGKLTNSNNKLTFIQYPDLDFGFSPIPVTQVENKSNINEVSGNENNTQKADYSYPPANTTYLRKQPINWMKIVLPVLAIALLGIAGYFGYNFYKNSISSQSESNETVENKPVKVDTLDIAADTTHSSIDTINNKIDTLANTTIQQDTAATALASRTPASNVPAYKVAVFNFNNEPSATAKANKLNSYGNKASVEKINGEFIVALMASHPLNDTTKLVDSLRRFFNPKGQIHIMK